MTDNAIERLHKAVEAGRRDWPLVRVGGPVREVTASAARVAGVSAFVRLGDRMGFSADGRV
jgi:flagellum-specific ATP synthase